MSVKIFIPERQDSTAGRRLFAMAAPIAGGAIGGPAGAAAGAVLAGRMGGQSVGDSLQGGIKTGIMSYGARELSGGAASRRVNPESPFGGDKMAAQLGQQGTAFSGDMNAAMRRISALGQSPPAAIADGIAAAQEFPLDHDIRKEVIPALTRAQMRYR